jgi:hypothetical protein
MGRNACEQTPTKLWYAVAFVHPWPAMGAACAGKKQEFTGTDLAAGAGPPRGLRPDCSISNDLQASTTAGAAYVPSVLLQCVIVS